MGDLLNASTGVCLSPNVDEARSPWRRNIGFLLLARIEPLRGLWFARCRAIHTLGMRSPVDVLLLDADGTVVALETNVRPNRPYVSHRQARTIVEMGPGFLNFALVRVGDQLTLDGPVRPLSAQLVGSDNRTDVRSVGAGDTQAQRL